FRKYGLEVLKLKRIFILILPITFINKFMERKDFNCFRQQNGLIYIFILIIHRIIDILRLILLNPWKLFKKSFPKLRMLKKFMLYSVNTRLKTLLLDFYFALEMAQSHLLASNEIDWNFIIIPPLQVRIEEQTLLAAAAIQLFLHEILITINMRNIQLNEKIP